MGNPGHVELDTSTVKPNTCPLTTTVIGSWPKPTWLSESGWAIDRWDIDRTWKFEGEQLRRKQDEGTEWALREQEATGVDIVSDGEERRDNYICYHCRHLDGFDFEQRVRKTVKAGAYDLAVPTVTGPVASRQVFLPADYQFVRDRTDRPVKMTLPGPMTIIDLAKDEYYGDEVVLAMDLAAAIRVEVEALALVGCDIVQFDEPAFVRYPEKVFEYGLRALEGCFDGITGITTVVHICCGAPSDLEGQPKANAEYYASIASALAISKIDQISIEGAHRPLDLEVLQKFGKKDIIFGLVDIGERCVETVEEIENRVRGVLNHVEPDRLLLGPDCGMIYLDPEVAKAKLTNLVSAAHRLREGL